LRTKAANFSGVSEMMQRDHRGQPAVEHAAQYGTVPIEGFFVPPIGRGLDAAPLDREAVGVLSRLDGAVEVFFPAAAPPIAGQPGFVTVEDASLLLFPGPPVVVGVIALDLVSGGGGTP
jgi:hypothetical protein